GRRYMRPNFFLIHNKVKNKFLESFYNIKIPSTYMMYLYLHTRHYMTYTHYVHKYIHNRNIIFTRNKISVYLMDQSTNQKHSTHSAEYFYCSHVVISGSIQELSRTLQATWSLYPDD